MLSVIILARNEANNLAELLPTLSFADRIIVIDDFSTDNTKEICDKYEAEWKLHRLNQDYAQARNFGLDMVKKGWVLFLDADERLPQQTTKEILKVTQNGSKKGYVFRRDDIFYGKKLAWGETATVRLLRLAKANSGRWRGKVHEVWDVGNTGEMQHEILHYSHESIGQLFGSVNRYSLIRAKELWGNKQYWNVWEQMVYPLSKFLYVYFVRLGILDGWRGLVMSVAMAWHSFLVRWYLWDRPWKPRGNVTQLWRYLMIMPVLLMPFGQLLRGSVWPVYAHEYFMMLAVAVTGIRVIRSQNKSFNFKVEHKILMSLCIVFGVSFVVSVSRGLPWLGGMQLLRWYLYVMYLGSLLWGVANGLEVSISGLINYYATLILVFGWLQYLLLPDTRFLSLLGWDDHYYRMVGTLFDPNFLGLMLILIAIWSFMRMKKPINIIFGLLATAGLAATFSRASWLTFILVVVYSLDRKEVKKRMLIAGAILGLAGSIWLLPRPGGEGVNILRQYSLKTRIESWNESIAIFRSNWLLGIGFNQYGNVVGGEGAFGAPFHPNSPDNSFLFVLATAGVLGATLFLGLLVFWWRNFPDPIMKLSLAAILIHSMANNSFFYPFVLMWWWLLMVYQQVKSNEKS